MLGASLIVELGVGFTVFSSLLGELVVFGVREDALGGLVGFGVSGDSVGIMEGCMLGF